MASDHDLTDEHPTLAALDLANDIVWWLQERDGMSVHHDGQGNVRAIGPDERVFDIHVKERERLPSAKE
ncbi:hypothetical protein AB0F91_46420 [Amycolatopsis sp. NPDC023774]|uniref:hypothetical protein n=1 Tax=Amycolatopsis sp. NPDC023774 TaxID=3155015 RepID=UPI0033C40393